MTFCSNHSLLKTSIGFTVQFDLLLQIDLNFQNAVYIDLYSPYSYLTFFTQHNYFEIPPSYQLYQKSMTFFSFLFLFFFFFSLFLFWLAQSMEFLGQGQIRAATAAYGTAAMLDPLTHCAGMEPTSLRLRCCQSCYTPMGTPSIPFSN